MKRRLLQKYAGQYNSAVTFQKQTIFDRGRGFFQFPTLYFSIRSYLLLIKQLLSMSALFQKEFLTFLQKQAQSMKKSDISDILFKLTGHTSQSNKTSIISKICQALVGRIKNMKNVNRTPVHASQYIINFLNENNFKLNEYKAKFLKDLINRQFSDNQINFLPMNPIEKNSKSLDTVLNIWRDQLIIQCICQQPSRIVNKKQSKEPCYRCGRMFHLQCLWPKSNDELYECPFCFLKYCLPTKQVKYVYFAGYLPRDKRQKNQFRLQFRIEKQTNLHFEARCARLNEKSRFEITWPDNCVIYLNKKKLAQFKPLAKNCPLKRRNDQEIMFERYDLNPGVNELIIEQKNYTDEKNTRTGRYDHVIMLFGVKRQDQQSIEKKLSCQRLDQQACKKMIKKILRFNSQIQAEKIKVQMECQYFGSIIKYPCRSRHCSSHYQPFDLKNFIMASLQSKNSTLKWKCPLCRKRAYDLVIDEYLYKLILQHPNQDIKEIFLYADESPQITKSNQIPSNSLIPLKDFQKDQSSQQKKLQNNNNQKQGQDQEKADSEDISAKRLFMESDQQSDKEKQKNDVKRPPQNPIQIIDLDESQTPKKLQHKNNEFHEPQQPIQTALNIIQISDSEQQQTQEKKIGEERQKMQQMKYYLRKKINYLPIGQSEKNIFQNLCFQYVMKPDSPTRTSSS